MKFTYGLPLLSVATLDRNATSNAVSQSCGAQVDCLIKDLVNKDPQFASKVRECEKEFDQVNKMKCVYKAGGMRPDQVDAIMKLQEATVKCSDTLSGLMQKCLSNCFEKDTVSCNGKCYSSIQEEAFKCLFNKANVANYDYPKAMKCVDKCNQTNMPDLFDCVYKCNEPIYKGLGAEVKVSNSAKIIQFDKLSMMAFVLPLTYLFIF